MFTFAEKLKQMSNIEHKDVGVSSLKGTPSRKIYIKTSTEAVYNPEGVTQEYINNHVDGSKIVDGTVTTSKIADNAVSMDKLDTAVKTLIQQGASSSWTPKGTYSVTTEYDANDAVYDETTNSSYLSLKADNIGHAVTDTEWWMLIMDGSDVNTLVAELQVGVESAIAAAQEDLAEATQAANEAASAANAKIDWVTEQVNDLTAYEVATALDSTSIIPVQNKVVTEKFKTMTEALDEIENKFITSELYVSKLSQAISSKTVQYLSTGFGLIAGQTYRVVIELGTTATATMEFRLRNVASSSTPSINLAYASVGTKTIEVTYTPSSETNYQYLSWWSNESNSNSFDIYFYIDEEIQHVAPAFTAEGTSYDNSTNILLSATNVQDAIEELEKERYEETLIFDGSIPSITLSSTSHALTTPAGFKVGKKYKIVVTISSSVSKIVYTYLRNIPSSSTPNIIFDGVSAPDLIIPAGETSKTCYYTPSAETNYQYFNRWGNVSTVVTTNWKVYEVSGWKERCDIIDSVGDDIFDIYSENVGYTNSSNLIVEKTESGYNFSCISAANLMYAFGSLSGLIVGNQYQLTFDYSHDLKVTTQYAGLVRLVKDSPLSSTINQYKAWILKNYTSPGSITYRFTAEGNSAFLKVAANDIGTNGSITLSNITLQNLGKVADIAEMIVEDMVEVDTDIANASVSGTYYGRKIPSVNASYKFGYSRYMSSGGNNSSRQGCAAYNGYLFEFGSGNAYVNIYNLATKTFHSTVTPTNISTGHCNTACFSTKFFDANDTFPLLYVSGDSNAKIQVYRVTLENDVFAITQVQNITMSLTLPAGSTTWGQAFLDNGKNRLWWLGARGWSSFAIPSIFDGDNNVISAVTLTSSDIKDSFGTSMPSTHLQGGIIVDGILYEVQGVPGWGDIPTFNVVDMRGKEDINYINLGSLGWTYEPEGVALYDRHLYVNTQGNGIYIIYIGK